MAPTKRDTRIPKWLTTNDITTLDISASDITANSIKLPYVSTANNLGASTSTHYIKVTASSKTVTLPTAVGLTGIEYSIDNSSAGDTTVATTSSQTIEGETTQTVPTNSCMVVVSDGSNWRIT